MEKNFNKHKSLTATIHEFEEKVRHKDQEIKNLT